MLFLPKVRDMTYLLPKASQQRRGEIDKASPQRHRACPERSRRDTEKKERSIYKKLRAPSTAALLSVVEGLRTGSVSLW